MPVLHSSCVVPGSFISHLATAVTSLPLYLHCAVPPLYTQYNGHVARPPRGGPVLKTGPPCGGLVHFSVGLSLCAAIFVVPWGRGQTPRHAALFSHLYLFCAFSPLFSKFRLHINDLSNGGPGIRCVSSCDFSWLMGLFQASGVCPVEAVPR